MSALVNLITPFRFPFLPSLSLENYAELCVFGPEREASNFISDALDIGRVNLKNGRNFPSPICLLLISSSHQNALNFAISTSKSSTIDQSNVAIRLPGISSTSKTTVQPVWISPEKQERFSGYFGSQAASSNVKAVLLLAAQGKYAVFQKPPDACKSSDSGVTPQNIACWMVHTLTADEFELESDTNRLPIPVGKPTGWISWSFLTRRFNSLSFSLGESVPLTVVAILLFAFLRLLR